MTDLTRYRMAINAAWVDAANEYAFESMNFAALRRCMDNPDVGRPCDGREKST